MDGLASKNQADFKHPVLQLGCGFLFDLLDDRDVPGTRMAVLASAPAGRLLSTPPSRRAISRRQK